jgi:hypothetical protein
MAVWRSTKIALVLVAVLIIGLWMVAMLLPPGEYTNRVSVAITEAPPNEKPAALKVETSKGQFSVPGRAFADGRDLEARPPLTVMQINVWDAVPRSRRVCSIRHGDEFPLLESKRSVSEDRHYFKIRHRDCEGWVPETFLSPKREPIIGDQH